MPFEPKMTPHKEWWAYCRWCDGYTQQQIADALSVSRTTIKRTVQGLKRIRPVLVYKEDEEDE